MLLVALSGAAFLGGVSPRVEPASSRFDSGWRFELKSFGLRPVHPRTVRLLRSALPETWRFSGEARALVEYEGAPVVATAAGVFIRRDGAWTALGTDAPAGLVRLVREREGLVGIDSAQRAFRLTAGKWEPSESRAAGLRTLAALDAPPPGSQGAFLSAAQGDIRSFWGDTHLWRRSQRWIPRPPSAGDYALLDSKGTLYAGTPDGIFAFDGNAWKHEPLPGDLPLARPHGIARVGEKWMVGGLQGLWMGTPGRWEEVTRQPVRQMLTDENAVWVLYGSGALDKFEPNRNRRYPDVLHGAAKRPWASCLGWSTDPWRGKRTLLIGGDGGWIEKEPTKFVEHYPAELKGQVVTAIVGQSSARYVGTQKAGFFRFWGDKVSNYNPGTGLKDPWVTCLRSVPSRPWREPSILIGTAGAGFFSLYGGRFTDTIFLNPGPVPTLRPRHLASFDSRLVIGGMDGAWEGVEGKWQPIPIHGEEVTALTAVGNDLAIVTAQGIYFVKKRR